MSSGLNKKISMLVLTALLCIGLGGCNDKSGGRLLTATNDEEVYGDKTGRYKSMSFLVNSYLDYAIFGITILPINKNELASGVRAPPISPELEENHWGGADSGGNFTWDKNWETPKKFKVWWQRITDDRLWEAKTSYDRYTNKETKPGSVWCEAIITIDKPLPLEPRYFTLHFYPDGHVEAYISASKEFEAEKSLVTYEDRVKLPVLKGKYCLKEIPNPDYGTPRPVPMY